LSLFSSTAHVACLNRGYFRINLKTDSSNDRRVGRRGAKDKARPALMGHGSPGGGVRFLALLVIACAQAGGFL